MGAVVNKAIVAVPHQYSYVIERFGKYEKVLLPGLNFLVPFVQKVQYKHSLKEQSFQIKAQNAVTKDNVIIQSDGILYLKVSDPVKCSYGAKDPIEYMHILAQGVMRSEIGKLTLDQTFEERQQINTNILESLSYTSEKWGIQCLRYEIRDIKVSDTIKKVMNLEAESERRKRAEILKSEGKQRAQINLAEAIKRGYILDAEGRSEQIILESNAQVKKINYLGQAIDQQNINGQIAAQYLIADKYIDSLGELANPSKNILLQNNLSDPSSMVNNSLDLLSNKQQQEEQKTDSKQDQN